MELTSYRPPLFQFTSFKYMGKVLASEDDNCPEVVRNLSRARQKWSQLNQILSREGADAWKLEHIYLAVVQLVMLNGSETWVLTPRMKRVLGGFHHGVSLRLMGRQLRNGLHGCWDYPPLEDVMTEAVFQEAETYASLRQNTVMQYIATRPIMDLYLAAKRRPGPRVAKKWWKDEGLDLEGMRTAAREAYQM